ncbi:MAG: alanine racemase [Elusimicrobiota bacterium]|nr:alanine racemase [Elusimicrobiota bacterium]
MKENMLIEIDRKAFLFNLKQVKNAAGGKKIFAVVKSNAYGHGAVELAREASRFGVWGFAVSNTQEAIQLRQANLKEQILVLGASNIKDIFRDALKFNFMPTLSDFSDLDAAQKLGAALKKNLKFHLAVDTGMGRIGLWHENVFALIDKIADSKYLKLDGIYTHFSTADTDRKWLNKQTADFEKIVLYARQKGLKFIAHAANSAAIFKDAKTHFDAVRPGICLYGLKPFEKYEKKVLLKPVLSWKTKIALIKDLPKGASVSYGRTFIAKKPLRIAVLPVGYWDGYSRALSGISKVLINGHFAKVLGRITMNMTIVDVTNIANAKVDDEVVLIGRQGKCKISADELAKLCRTIDYEFVCGINQLFSKKYL